jgi:predicted nucleic acid-binding protein
MKEVAPPLLVCEPVLTEVAYFLREDGLTVDPLFQMMERGAIRLGLELGSHWQRVRVLMARYRQMDLADASVVAMCELHPQSQVLTVDRRDFSVYRRNDRQVINFIAPGSAAR